MAGQCPTLESDIRDPFLFLCWAAQVGVIYKDLQKLDCSKNPIAGWREEYFFVAKLDWRPAHWQGSGKQEKGQFNLIVSNRDGRNQTGKRIREFRGQAKNCNWI